jgi:putative ABC transport system ATP-binding protein
MIQLSHIYKSYRLGKETTPILKDLSLQVAAGEFVALMGKSGSGKTTAMNIMGLMDRADGGHYYLDNKEVSNLNDDAAAILRNQTIGFIFQSFFLLPRMNALENVGLPLTYRDVPVEEIEKRGMQSLEKVELPHLFDHLPIRCQGDNNSALQLLVL